MSEQVCRKCGKTYIHQGPGRPFVNCPDCRMKPRAAVTDPEWMEGLRARLRDGLGKV